MTKKEIGEDKKHFIQIVSSYIWELQRGFPNFCNLNFEDAYRSL